MPETFYELDEVPPGKGHREVTVSRSHSDSKKPKRVLSTYGQINEGASEEEIEKLRVSSRAEYMYQMYNAFCPYLFLIFR